MRPRHLVGLLVGLALLHGCATGDAGDAGATASADVDLARGQQLFAQNCATCHGPEAQGTAQGPPLVHELYVPSHHSDESFQVAVARGVQPHHWDFGAMPPIPSLDRDEVTDITAHVRQLQADAGVIDASD